MDGESSVVLASALDHDRWFKELITTFFVEFLDLFFPKLAAAIDRESVEFLSEEHFANLHDGNLYRVDIIAKVRYKEQVAYFLIHIEHQSTVHSDFPLRLFRYFTAIFEKRGLPIFPIVVYSHDMPRKKQPDVFRLVFPEGEVLRFRFHVVQLNRLSWRRYVKTENPVASALMAKMKVAPRDRPRVKLQCLRLLVTLRLDPARMKLIASFVDAYLRLNPVEEKRFQHALQRAELKPKEEEALMEYVTSWEERGIEKGLQMGLKRGREEGRQEGRLEACEAMRGVLLEILSRKFGSLPEESVSSIRMIDSVDELQRLVLLAVSADSLVQLKLMKETRSESTGPSTR
jgi:predicted transposase YdaD